jgi:hypothetical protein
MHPTELKNRALVAAAVAEKDGYTATGAALIQIARACASESLDIEYLPEPSPNNWRKGSMLGRVIRLEDIH